MEQQACFVEFEIPEEERFAALCRVYVALKRAKESGEWGSEQTWLVYFDTEARHQFWWPTPEEVQAHLARWRAAPAEQRQRDPTLQALSWTFGSMIEMFDNIDVVLLECRRVAPDRGRLEFLPNGWPYGGTGCLRMLLQAFGCRVVGADAGFGYEGLQQEA